MKPLTLALLAVGGYALWLESQRHLPPRIVYKPQPEGTNACTIPGVGIFIDPRHAGNAKLLQHELNHWAQYQRLGSAFVSQYLLGQLFYGYDRNPLEVEARYGLEVGRCLTEYTDCVRTGQAATVHNPRFHQPKA
jgi:hypothetical protein